MENILGYDCDGQPIEEYRILRFPFSDTVDNWDEVPNVEPRFYCAVKLKNNEAYLISVYDDYNMDAIRKYEKIKEEEQIPTKVRLIEESKNYEVAFDGITRGYWYYDRDRDAIKNKLELLIKNMKNKRTIDLGEER